MTQHLHLALFVLLFISSKPGLVIAIGIILGRPS